MLQPYNLRFLPFLLLMVGLAASPAAAQMIVIKPDPGANVLTLNEDASLYSAEDWPEDTLQLVAILIQPDETTTDITNEATWVSADPSKGIFTGPGVLLLLGDGDYTLPISAEANGLSSGWIPVRVKEPPTVGSQGGTAGGGPLSP